MLRILSFTLFSAWLTTNVAHGIIGYDEGRLEINGIQLFQDSENHNSYYYLPPYPRISEQNGEFEFLCLKYVDVNWKASSGGLFHVLVQFSLSKEEIVYLERQLQEIFPKARIMGAVPMMQDEQQDAPGFRIVSTLLNTQENNLFTTNLISSGKAPFLPGSKAAIAAHLTPDYFNNPATILR